MALTEFERQIITNRTGGAKHIFAGYKNEPRKLQVRTQLKPSMIMQTPKTWRACRACCTPEGNSKVVAVDHGNKIISFKKCGSCKGTGMVFG